MICMEIDMLTLHTETFLLKLVPSDWAEEYGYCEGSIEVTFEGKRRRVRCLAPSKKFAHWVIYSLAARYATGTKVWHASAVYDGQRVLEVWTGFDNRSGRYSQPRLVGFIADVGKQHVSKR